MAVISRADANKGSGGRAVVVGGSREYCGAPAMCALSAYRAGAGLVQVAVPASVLPVVASHALEPIYLKPIAVEWIQTMFSN